MGLTPRKDVPTKKLGWDDLNRLLKATIDNDARDNSSTVIKLVDYEPTEAEIKQELSKNGYSFENPCFGYLKIF